MTATDEHSLFIARIRDAVRRGEERRARYAAEHAAEVEADRRAEATEDAIRDERAAAEWGSED